MLTCLLVRGSGDPDEVYVVGQSAGAHLAATCIAYQAIRVAESGPLDAGATTSQGPTAPVPTSVKQASAVAATSPCLSPLPPPQPREAPPGSWPPFDIRRIRGFVGLSGVYNIERLTGHFHRRGLYHRMQRQASRPSKTGPFLGEDG